MSVSMPETPEEMLLLPGVTKANFEKYGKKLLDLCINYSSQKFLILSEKQDDIEEFKTQERPGTSRSYESNDWIDVDNPAGSSKSKYFSKRPTAAPKKRKPVRRKKRKSPKKTNYTRKLTPPTKAPVFNQARKSFTRAVATYKSPKSYSHMASGSGTNRATGIAKKATASSSNASGSSGGLGLMPMPKPIQRKLNF